MSSRKFWFLFFYFILLIFVVYNFVYLIIIWNNKALYNLLSSHFTFTVTDQKTNFYANSFFLIFYLPMIGAIVGLIGWILTIIGQAISFQKIKVNGHLWLLIISFSITMVGFLLDFAAQFFYNQWKNSSIIIIIGQNHQLAIDYYQNWFSATELWIILGTFFGIFVACIVMIGKLYILNFQWFNYLKSEQKNHLSYENIKLYERNKQTFDFNPTESKTITIVLEKDKKLNNKKNAKKTPKK